MGEGRRGYGREFAIVLVAMVAASVGAWWLATPRTREAAVAKAPIPPAPSRVEGPAPPAPPAPARTDEKADESIITLEEIRAEIEADKPKEEAARLLWAETQAPLAPPDGPVTLSVKFVGEGSPPKSLVVYATPDDDDAESLRGEVRVRLADGAREGRLPAGKTYGLRFVLDGWPSDQRFDALPVPKDQRVAIEVGLPAEPSVRAVDAVSGRPIAGARARPVPEYEQRVFAPEPWRGDGQDVQGGDDGRIVLGKTAVGHEVWIGAEGYAWTRTRVGPSDRDRSVTVGSGGSIRVDVEGGPGARRVQVTTAPIRDAAGSGDDDDRVVYPEHGVPLASTGRSGQFAIDGLSPGRWRVWIGRWGTIDPETPFDDGPLILAVREVEVRGGSKEQVRVDMGREARGLDVALQLVVPPAWKERPSVRIEGCGEATARRGSRTAVRLLEGVGGSWTAPLTHLVPGPYTVNVDPGGFTALVRVRAYTTSARVVVPPPVSFRARIVDAETGKPVRAARVSVDSVHPSEEFPAARGLPASPEPADAPWVTRSVHGVDAETDGSGECVVRVATGRLLVSVCADDYVAVYEAAVDAPTEGGEVVRVFRLWRRGTILVHILRHGRIPVAVTGRVSWTELASDGSDARDGIRDAEDLEMPWASLDGLRPGRYRVRCRIDGVAERLERIVEVKAGEETVVDFELSPR